MARSIVARAGSARRQAAYRARQKAKLAAMKAALEKAAAGYGEALGEGKSAPAVLAALARIERAVSQQNARLVAATRIEHGERILKRLVELERLVRGGDLHIPTRHSRRRPLGA